MIKIALCDDDARALPVIAGAAESAFRAGGIQPRIYQYRSGKELLSAMEQTCFHIILLDIEMPGMDGIAIGKELRKRKDDTKIIYVSECENRVFESFLVQPLGFVRKSNFLNDIAAMVDLYITTSTQEQGGQYLDFTTRNGLLTMKSHQVRYIEGSRNYQLLYLEGKSDPVEIKMTMNALEEMTQPCGFIRVHKGYLVNYLYIQRLCGDHLILQDGTELPIGRSKTGEVKLKYLNLIGR